MLVVFTLHLVAPPCVAAAATKALAKRPLQNRAGSTLGRLLRSNNSYVLACRMCTARKLPSPTYTHASGQMRHSGVHWTVKRQGAQRACTPSASMAWHATMRLPACLHVHVHAHDRSSPESAAGC